MLGLDLLHLVVYGLALARITRFVTDDSFPPMAAVRSWYIRHAPGAWADLVECPWCVSAWLAIAAMVAVLRLPARPCEIVAVVAAWSLACGLIGKVAE